MNFLFFHLGFYFSGGGEKLVIEEIRGFQKLGVNVKCFSSIVDTKSCFPDIINKYPIYPILPQLPEWFPKHHTVQLLVTCILFPFLSYRFKNFDVCFAANQPSLYFAYWLKKIFKIPYVSYLAQPLRLLHPRNVDKSTGLYIRDKLQILPSLVGFFHKFIDWADRTSVLAADLVLVNGFWAKSVIDSTYKINSEVVSAGCYPVKKIVARGERFDGMVNLGKLKIKKPYIFLTNRHFPQKRFEYAVSALAVLLANFPNLSLVISGEEMEYTGNVKMLAGQLGILEKVIFTGIVSEKVLSILYQNSTVYIYTAPEEDFGMGIIEAMASGTPVVAWDKAGPGQIMKGNIGGFLAKPYVIEDYIKKISLLIKNSQLWRRKSIQGLTHVRKNFTYVKHNGIIYDQMKKLMR